MGLDSTDTDTLDRDSINAIFLNPADWDVVTRWGSMTGRLVAVVVMVVDLAGLCYSTAQVQETMHHDATADCLVGEVFGCAKAGIRGVTSRHVIIVHYVN